MWISPRSEPGTISSRALTASPGRTSGTFLNGTTVWWATCSIIRPTTWWWLPWWFLLWGKWGPPPGHWSGVGVRDPCQQKRSPCPAPALQLRAAWPLGTCSRGEAAAIGGPFSLPRPGRTREGCPAVKKRCQPPARKTTFFSSAPIRLLLEEIFVAPQSFNTRRRKWCNLILGLAGADAALEARRPEWVGALPSGAGREGGAFGRRHATVARRGPSSLSLLSSLFNTWFYR